MQRAENRLILLVSGDTTLRDTLTQALVQAGYSLFATANATSAVATLLARSAVALIVDVGYPASSGQTWDLVRQLPRLSAAPFLVITSERSAEQRKLALRLGAWDALSRPVHSSEVVARVSSLCQQSSPELMPPVVISPSLVIDLEGSLVARHNTMVSLTSQENLLLSCLARRSNRIVSTEELCHRLGVVSDQKGRALLRELVRRVRHKLQDDEKEQRCLLTRRGQGYYLAVPKPSGFWNTM